DESLVGTEIGPYHLLEHLGSGGMGSVFRAERIGDDFEREVALKLIRPGLLDEEAKRGFRQERQILASLTHPGIARLYDGGTGPEDRLYFSMELVEGEDLMQFVASRESGLAERLDLFLDVARAIAYAHARLVLHLDLKPANILVSQEGELKVLDFGVAERLQEGEQSRQTSDGQSQYRYTLAYASPEQLRREAVSTRSDVYSLGVLLYQLLTGMLPVLYEKENPLAYRAKVLQSQISPPSGKVPEAGISRDLDSIVMHCLESEPEARYASVDQLIADLEAYQQSRPISLRLQEGGYVLSKYVRRQKGILISAAIGILALVLLGTYYTLQVQAQRDEALREAQKNEQLLTLMQDIFLEADPEIAQGDTLSIYDLLAQAEGRLDTTLKKDPELWIPLNNTLAYIYLGMNEYERSEQLLNRSIALIESDSAAIPLPLQEQSWYYLGDWQFGNAEYAKARRSTLLALAINRQLGEDEGYYEFYMRLGDIEAEERQFLAADSLYQLALKEVMQSPEPDPAELARVNHILGALNRDLGKFAEAERYLRRSLEIKHEIFEPPHSEIAYTLNHMASLFLDQGKFDSAAVYARNSFEQRKAVYGENHIETVASLSNLGHVYQAKGEMDSSLRIKQQTAAIIENLFPEPHPYRLAMYSQLGNHHLNTGDHRSAEREYRKGIEMYQALRARNPDNAYLFPGSLMYHGLAQSLRLQKRYQEALPYSQQAYELYAKLDDNTSNEYG
ncbi:MAG: serine/threonine-protein kinase, partial [Bacteroidota bacterium]